MYGIHAADALVLERGFFQDDELYLARNDKRITGILHKAQKNRIRIFRVSPAELTRRTGAENHQGIAIEFDGALRPPELDKKAIHTPGIFIAADNIQDPQNLGAIIRTMDAFGARGLILPRHESAPLSETALKVSSGAMLNMPVLFTGKIAGFLNNIKNHEVAIVGAALEGEPLNAEVAEDICSYHQTVLIVLGSEQKGLSDLAKKRCHRLLRIEQYGNVQSLNVSASAAIFLYQFQTAFKKLGK